MNQLALKYRPQTLDDFIGHKSLIDAVKKNLKTTQTYLFHGVRGCGKTTMARIIANELKIDHMDIHEINAADKNGVDDMRAVIENASLMPMNSAYKIYIIDECHELTSRAENSLLKILEEPPKNVYFVLCTTEPNEVLTTIRSRCKAGMFEFTPLNRRTAFELLDKVITTEGLTIQPEVKQAILKYSEGIPREILGLLDKVRNINDIDNALEQIKKGTEDDVEVKDLLNILISKTFFGSDAWPNARFIVKNLTADPEKVRRSVLGYLSAIALNSDDPYEICSIMECFEGNYFSSGKAGLVLSVYRACCLGYPEQ